MELLNLFLLLAIFVAVALLVRKLAKGNSPGSSRSSLQSDPGVIWFGDVGGSHHGGFDGGGHDGGCGDGGGGCDGGGGGGD